MNDQTLVNVINNDIYRVKINLTKVLIKGRIYFIQRLCNTNKKRGA